MCLLFGTFGFNVFCWHLRHSQGFITTGVLHSDRFPCLTLKAHNAKLMLAFLDVCMAVQVAKLRASNIVNGEVLNASCALRSLTVWFDRIERGGRFLSQPEADQIFSATKSFLSAYQRLGLASALSGGARWKYLAKLHAVRHLGENMAMTRVNARSYHCFRDEDHIGLLKRLAQRVTKGPLLEFRIPSRWLMRLDQWAPEG